MRSTLVALLLFVVPIAAFSASEAEIVAAGRAAYANQDFDKAVELFERAVKLNPKQADYHYLLGGAYGQQAQRASLFKQAGLAKKTKAELEQAVALDPKHIDARLALIDYYMIAPGFLGGSIDKAKEQAAEIKKFDSLQGHRAMARVYSRDKKPDLARKEFVDAVREQPNSGKAHYYLGVFYLGEKNYKGAIQELEAALKLEPTHMPIYFRLGQYAAQTGSDYARGETSLRKYLAYKPRENEPGLEWAWYWLGSIYEQQGKKADARASYLNAQKIAPKAKDINEALKRVS